MNARGRDLEPLRLRAAGPRPELAWAEGGAFCVPARLLGAGILERDGADGMRIVSERRCDQALAQGLRLLRAYTDARPLSSRLPFSYQRVPPRVRSLIAQCMGLACRAGAPAARGAGFPAFPLDLSADFLADLAGEANPFREGATPVILSHDLDSHGGLVNFLLHFAPLEEAVAARSVNFVPIHAWPLDRPRLDELRARGHEVGVHGFDHSNKTPFLDEKKQQRRLAGACTLCGEYGAMGYRAPSLLRTRRLLAALAARFAYDSSIPTSGGRFPVPDNGCASARPFRAGSIAELPLSMPRDGSLRFLGHDPREILEIWKDCAARIAASGGVVVVLTHCEERFSGNPAMLESYRLLLEHFAAAPEYAFSTAEAVLRQAGLWTASAE